MFIVQYIYCSRIECVCEQYMLCIHSIIVCSCQNHFTYYGFGHFFCKEGTYVPQRWKIEKVFLASWWMKKIEFFQ